MHTRVSQSHRNPCSLVRGIMLRHNFSGVLTSSCGNQYIFCAKMIHIQGRIGAIEPGAISERFAFKTTNLRPGFSWRCFGDSLNDVLLYMEVLLRNYS